MVCVRKTNSSSDKCTLQPLPIFIVGLTYGHVFNWLCTLPFKLAYGGVAAVVIIFGVILWAMSGKLNELSNEDAE